MEHVIRLESLPPGLEFPRDLRDQIRYDADAKKLVYRGFMSKADFDRLCQLSDDWAYRRPLEDLFRMCAEDEPRSVGKGVFGLVSLFRPRSRLASSG